MNVWKFRTGGQRRCKPTATLLRHSNGFNHCGICKCTAAEIHVLAQTRRAAGRYLLELYGRRVRCWFGLLANLLASYFRAREEISGRRTLHTEAHTEMASGALA